MLIGNQHSIFRTKGSVYGTGVFCGSVYSLFRDGEKRNRFAGGINQISGVPYGYRPPKCMLISQKSGAMSGTSTASGECSIAMSGGKNAEASGSATGTGSCSLSLIVNLIADGSAVSVGSISMSGALYGSGTGSATSTGTGLIGAIVGLFATGTATGTGACTATAIGHMEAEGGGAPELSPEGLASALWNSLASDYNYAGTMGEKLNDAGSASNPWTEVITEGGYTAAELMRMFASVLGGKSTVTFLGGVTYQVTFESVDDDNKIVVDATVVNSERTVIDYDLT